MKNRTPTMESLSTNDYIEDYRIEKSLSRSSNREVFLALDKKDNKVIIKRVKGTRATESVIRNEIECGIQLQHPGIVKFIGFIEKSLETLLFFEYIEGEDLFAYMSKDHFKNPISEKEARKIFKQLLQAMLHCHSRQWCHHDLKLENVMMDKRKKVKLIDFGFAEKIKHEEISTLWCGSHDYVCPEVLSRSPYCPYKADSWSLGTILYILLYAELPFGFQRRSKAISKGKPHPPIIWADHRIPVPISSTAKDLISRMLEPCASKRITLEQVAKHEWVSGNHQRKLLLLHWIRKHVINVGSSTSGFHRATIGPDYVIASHQLSDQIGVHHLQKNYTSDDRSKKNNEKNKTNITAITNKITLANNEHEGEKKKKNSNRKEIDFTGELATKFVEQAD